MKQFDDKKQVVNWGQRLMSVLKERGMSQRKAALIAGVPTSTLNSWSAGCSPSDLRAVKKLADHLGLSFAWLLTGEAEIVKQPDPMLAFEDSTVLFDGYVKVTIERMIPRERKDET